jgi:hypothetical protein
VAAGGVADRRAACSEPRSARAPGAPGFDAIQHLTGPVLVDDTETPDTGYRVETHVRGYYHLMGKVWEVHGNYVVRVRSTPRGWVVADLTLEVFYQSGNPDLPAKAQERAASSPRVPRPRLP